MLQALVSQRRLSQRRRLLPGAVAAVGASLPGMARAEAWSALAQVTTSRSYTVEIGIVVLFTAAALFAVCRTGE